MYYPEYFVVISTVSKASSLGVVPISRMIKVEPGTECAVFDSMVKESLSEEVLFVEEVGEECKKRSGQHMQRP